MKILRVCHTIPSVELPSASIQQYYINKYSKYKSIYFLRDQNSELIFNLGQKVFLFKNIFSSQNIISKNINKIFLNVKMIFSFFINIRKEINIVHCHSINYMPFLIFVRFFTKNKTYLSLGGTDLYKLKKFKILIRILNLFDSIFVISDEFKEILKENKIRNIINHYNGVDNKIFYNMNLQRKDVFVSISNIRKVKDIETLIISFAKFHQTYNRYKLIIIGKIYYDDYFNKLKKKINDLKITESIIFTNSLKHQEISKILNEAKACLLTSESEGFPKVIIESISTETPIIASDVGNISNISDCCGLIVQKGDTVGFTNAMLEIIENDNLRKKFIFNCKSKFGLYDWANLVKIIDDEYSKS